MAWTSPRACISGYLSIPRSRRCSTWPRRSGAQPKRLAAAILAFAQNVDKLDVLKPAIERIAGRHVDTHIKPEHYPAVANALLPAIRDILGEAATDEILAAWGEAYWFLADILIAREAELYDEAQAA